MKSLLRRPLGRVLAAAVIAAGAGAAYAVTRPGEPVAVVANLWVNTAAGDGPCRFAAVPIEYDPALACDSLREAYETASRGGTVRVRPGRYPDEFFGGVRDAATGSDTPAAHDGAVTFIGNPERPTDVRIHRLHVGGDGVTIDGFDIDSGG